MKSIVLILSLCLSALTFAEDLPENAVPKMVYTSITIYSVDSLSVNSKFVPATSNSSARFDVSLVMRLEVEGNLCTGKVSTFGKHYGHDQKSQATVIDLIAGNMPSDFGCLQYGKPTHITLKETFSFYGPKMESDFRKYKIAGKLIEIKKERGTIRHTVR